MKRMSFAIVAAVAAGALLVGGCRYDQPRSGPAGTASRAGTTESVTGVEREGDEWGRAAARNGDQPRQRTFGIPEMAFPTGDDQTSLVHVSVMSSQDQVRVGQPFVYRMRVTNLSDELTLEDVTIHQDLPGSVEVADVQPQGLMAEGEPGQWRIGELSPGQTREFDIAVVPREEGTFESCVRVTYSPVLCTAISVVAPQLQLTQEAPQQVLVCEPIPVRYTVANTGSGYTEPVTIRAQLPEGVFGPRGERDISIPVGALGPGERETFTVRLNAERTGELVTGAMATTEDGQEVRAEAQPTLIVAPRLEIQIQGPETEFMERPMEYTARIHNGGDGPALDAMLRLDTEGRAQLTEVRGQAEQPVGPGRDRPSRRGAGEISLGNIPPGDTVEVTFSMTAQDPGPVRIAAMATALCADQPMDEIVTEVRGITSLLLELVDTNDPVRIGEPEVYRISVLNQGRIADHNVQIAVRVPAGFEIVDVEGSTPAQVEEGRITLSPVGELPPRRRAVWTIRVIAREPGDHRFGVELTSEALEEPVIATEATRVY